MLPTQHIPNFPSEAADADAAASSIVKSRSPRRGCLLWHCGCSNLRRPNRNQPAPAVLLSSGYLLSRFGLLGAVVVCCCFVFWLSSFSLSFHVEAGGGFGAAGGWLLWLVVGRWVGWGLDDRKGSGVCWKGGCEVRRVDVKRDCWWSVCVRGGA